MSYRRHYSALGAVSTSDLASLAQKASSLVAKLSNVGSQVLDSAMHVVEDPALPEVACRVNQLWAIENKRTVPACPKTSTTLRGGVGLRQVLIPMRGVVYAQQHPWVKPAAVAAVLGVPFLIGYLVGRS